MAWRPPYNPQHGKWAQLYTCTLPELSLEAAIATLGVPYRVQFPCHLYLPKVDAFPDFLLPTLGLVIEVDGPEHYTPAGLREDEDRTDLFEKKHGWTVVRCKNKEAEEDPAEVLDRLLKEAGINLKTDRSRLGPSLIESLPKCRRGGKIR